MLLFTALGASMMLALTGIADAKDTVYRAGPITVPTSPCLIAKLNPGHGELCAPPEADIHGDPAARAASYLRRAQFFVGIYEFKEARRAVDEGLTIKRDDFDLLLLSGRLAISLDDLNTHDVQRGEQDIERALKLRPLDPDVRATYLATKRFKFAPNHLIREYGIILTGDPQHDFSRRARAEILLELGRYSDALADLNVLVARDPDEPIYLHMRAASHAGVKDHKAAIADFSGILRLETNDLMALSGRAVAFEMIGDDEKALADYDAILGPVGGNPLYAIGGDTLGQYLNQRAYLLVRLKRFNEAATDMVAALIAKKSSVLRAQVFLRQNGFNELPLDGRDTPPLRSALQTCLGQQSCFDRLQRGI